MLDVDTAVVAQQVGQLGQIRQLPPELVAEAELGRRHLAVQELGRGTANEDQNGCASVDPEGGLRLVSA